MNSPSETFLDFHYNSRNQSGTARLPVESWPEEWTRIFYKGYPRFDLSPLPKARFGQTQPLHEVMLNRHSSRRFAHDRPLTLEELSRILSGLKLVVASNDPTSSSRRAYASAGGRYPIEAYILPLGVDSLAPHVFHYHVRSHGLEKLWSFSPRQYQECFPEDEWCNQAAAAIVLTACYPRGTVKYGDRAYRFCLLEAGEIAQNIELLCAAEQLACCSYGGFQDEAVMRLLDVNPNEELVMHVMFIGKPTLGA